MKDLLDMTKPDAKTLLAEIESGKRTFESYWFGHRVLAEVAEKVKLMELNFSECSFTDESLTNAVITKSEFIACEFSGYADNISLEFCELRDCAFDGFQFAMSSKFSNCNFHNCDFGRAEFKRSLFELCMFRGCDFVGAEFVYMAFDNVFFDNSNLDCVDMRTVFPISLVQYRGTIVDSEPDNYPLICMTSRIAIQSILVAFAKKEGKMDYEILAHSIANFAFVERNWCWDEYMAYFPPEFKQWAIDILKYMLHDSAKFSNREANSLAELEKSDE